MFPLLSSIRSTPPISVFGNTRLGASERFVIYLKIIQYSLKILDFSQSMVKLFNMKIQLKRVPLRFLFNWFYWWWT